MFKDIHLIEAAFQADRIVISMDETVRYCFHEITRRIRALKRIAWVNPCKSEEMPIDWLKNGAELERERLLGYHTIAWSKTTDTSDTNDTSDTITHPRR